MTVQGCEDCLFYEDCVSGNVGYLGAICKGRMQRLVNWLEKWDFLNPVDDWHPTLKKAWQELVK